MSPGTWALTGLCVAGAIAAAVPAVQTIIQARALQAHAKALGESDLAGALGKLPAQASRVGESLARFAPPAERIRVALASLTHSLATIKHAVDDLKALPLTLK